jgi:Bifunctional DNA primase/polymerase, N-terminal
VSERDRSLAGSGQNSPSRHVEPDIYVDERGIGLESQQRLHEALDAVERGRVFLLAPRSKKPRRGAKGYNCLDPDCADETHVHARSDRSEIQRRFAADPNANYAIIPRAGRFILDIDGVELPFELPITATVFTGGRLRHGRPRQHQWFTLPSHLWGWTVHGKQHIQPGIDIVGSIGSPHYVVGVGSVHPDTGNVYAWAPGRGPADVAIATAPPELLALLHEHKLLIDPTQTANAEIVVAPFPPKDQPVSATCPSRLTDRNLDTCVATAIAWIKRRRGLSRIADGQGRQDTLARCGFFLHQQGLSGTDAVQVLLVVNRQICDPPLPPSRFNGLAERIDRKPCGATPALSGETRRAVRQLGRAVNATPWRGTRAINAKKLLFVWIDTARRTDQLTLAISDRRAAELAGMACKTAAKARRYLIERGWLLGHHGGGHGRTSAYTLTLPAPSPPATDTEPTTGKNRIGDRSIFYEESGLLGQAILFLADQFRHGQGRFGAIGLQILQALGTGNTFKNASLLARHLGLLPDTVQKKLKLLAKCKLALKAKDGWRRGPAALEVTYEARDRDVVRHRAERARHHTALAARGIQVEVDTPTILLRDMQRHGLTQRPNLVRDLLAARDRAAPDLAAKILPDHHHDAKVRLIDAYRTVQTTSSAPAPVNKRSSGERR